ncbi:hypothetical protein DL769_006429 [Monosporascus sp. CRB-8-3]|nr:hypothetical protein DL769_006429 [Monosporascus sp. CRB-8-3]
MRFSKLLLANSAPRTPSTPELELDALLGKHTLALAPRLYLTDALTKLDVLLRKVTPSNREPPYIQGKAGNEISGLADLGRILEILIKKYHPVRRPRRLYLSRPTTTERWVLTSSTRYHGQLAETPRPLIPAITRSILKKTEPLLDLVSSLDLASIIDIVKDVDLKAILYTLSPLLAPETIESLVTLLNDASELLTKEAVDALKTVLSRVQLLINSLGKLIYRTKTLILGAVPLLAALGKIDLESLIDQVKSLLTSLSEIDLAGLIDQAQPLLDLLGKGDSGGLLEKTNSLGDFNLERLVDKITLILDAAGQIDFAGLIGLIASIPNPVGKSRPGRHLRRRLSAPVALTCPRAHETIVGGAAQVVGAIKRVDIASLPERARPLLGALDRIDIEGIMDHIAPLITPESIKAVVTVLSNAESLLTSAFVSQTTELAGHATPICLCRTYYGIHF